MSTEASSPDVAAAHRRHAVECNNLAWSLSEQGARSAAEDEDMLNAAHASAFHWSRAGNELNAARAWMLLGRVHALLGNGREALRYARQSHDYLVAHDPPDWELAFAHAVLAHAAWAAGDGTLHALHHAKARELGEAIADAEDRSIFLGTFGTIPQP